VRVVRNEASFIWLDAAALSLFLCLNSLRQPASCCCGICLAVCEQGQDEYNDGPRSAQADVHS